MDIKHLEEKLEAEKQKLEAELSEVATVNPANPSDWEPKPAERDVSQADDNVVADAIEDFEDNAAVTGSLESRLNDVRSGLDKIKHNVYGKCQICQKDIEEDRLDANPAARTCKEHKELL